MERQSVTVGSDANQTDPSRATSTIQALAYRYASGRPLVGGRIRTQWQMALEVRRDGLDVEQAAESVPCEPDRDRGEGEYAETAQNTGLCMSRLLLDGALLRAT
jgi:hypothetical protein